ncbi:N-acetylmuramoyl-L-alanine amidase [Paenibacillus sp. 1011MAR3C5]|uniref:N-acetylmuramoyl-L-alanine amidase n=1 Tax=Paenibacillus sp. 1011MAR3C5 TaxID=1675787 RepID=UPI002175CAC9|nr:N-acetylmuramoyl-L-alanine amidase [Paenibacillus sp. 1011MAR3C5]
MTYIIDHIPKSTPCNRRPGRNGSDIYYDPQYRKSTARNERNWLTNPTNKVTASCHIAIDERETIECLPLNEVGWHAGDGSKAVSGNRTSIGIEICESGDYAKTLNRAAELVANMLRERGWGVDWLRRHYDWSRKNCPRLMNKDGKWTGWTEFKTMVSGKLTPLKPTEPVKPTQPSTNTATLSFVNVIVNGTKLSDDHITNSTTYVPAREIAAAVGEMCGVDDKVTWDAATRTVCINK